MAKLTLDDLKKIKEKQKTTFALREGGNRAKITVAVRRRLARTQPRLGER